MSTILPGQTFNIAEPIPGYRTHERIGAGGYGEVWKAEAPGGIAKAIKIVYGYHDDERAARELNALNRIKEASHPFVLSLERIEMVDGHLVIVTELATSNMKQLFEQYRRSGLQGIPRRELLDHLRDAADALDYLCREHSLQHLDVKPENLLLVGGRIKVGDFGLVKDLQDVNCSMITGLTPVYAAPELFDGRPNNRSDQYSLAVVYVEMLTGAPPFEGRTTAQLAAQHLHGRPRLDRLPASDQATIARALAKDPEQRFASCREMVDSLLEVTPNFRSAAPAAPSVRPYPSAVVAAPTKTEAISREELRAAAPGRPAVRVSEALEPAPPMGDLPPVELDAEETAYRPAVFLGLGGLGVHSLQSLHARLAGEFGDPRAVPALQLVALDTDAETLRAVTECDGPARLPDDCVTLLPLRSAADYRGESEHHLQWLNRRWLYNIPRSLQTQGLRPLGRLALVDHCQRAAERIRRAICEAVDPKGVALSAQSTGLPFAAGAPRVFLVSSISGGTGGGMVLDVAYLVRGILREMGLSDEGLCGLLVHCTGRNPPGRDLSVPSACACLAELQYYSDPLHPYSAGEACGMGAFAADVPPLAETYVLPLGEDLEQKDYLAAANKLAKYLYANAVTRAAPFFDKCRALRGGHSAAPTTDPPVRTFGLCQLGFSYDDVPAATIDAICHAVIMRWRGLDADEENKRPTSLADPGALLVSRLHEGHSAEDLGEQIAERAESMGLDVRQVVGQLYAAAVGEMGNDPESYLRAVLEQVIDASGRRSAPAALVVEAVDTVIRCQSPLDGRLVCLESVLQKHVDEMAARHAPVLREWLLDLVSSPAHRVAVAQRSADMMADYLRGMGREASVSLQALRQQLSALRKSLLEDKARNREWLRARGFAWKRRLVIDRQLSEYFHLSIEELTRNGVCRLVSAVLAQAAATGDKIRNLAADLNRMAEEFQRPAQGATASRCPTGGGDDAMELTAEAIRSQRAELVAGVDGELAEDLRRVATTEDHAAASLAPRLRRCARAAVLRTLKKVVLEQMSGSDEGKPDERIFSLAAGLRAAAPRLSDCGGGRRLLLVTPRDLPAEQLLGQLGHSLGAVPTVVPDAEDGILICYEAEDLSLRRVAAAVLAGRSAYLEVATRLHTRSDVPWGAL